MDVQSAVATAQDPPSLAAPVAPPPVQASSSTGSTSSTSAPTSAPAAGAAGHPAGDAKLSDAVGKLFGSGGQVTVSYKIEKPDEIVTVFTDAGGTVIAQFPSEMMVKMAEFFQQLAGGMLDKSV